MVVVVVVAAAVVVGGYMKGAPLCVYTPPPPTQKKNLFACLFWVFNNSFNMKLRGQLLPEVFLKVTESRSCGPRHFHMA